MTDEQFKVLLNFLNGFENHLTTIQVYLEQLTRNLP